MTYPRQITTAVTAGVREYLRTPVLVALLGFLPIYFIGFFTTVAPDTPVRISVPGTGLQSQTVTDVYAVMLPPVVAALIAGFAGLFLMRAARDTDARLVRAGYHTSTLILARFGVMAVAAAIGTGVATGVASLVYTPVAIGLFLIATFLTGLTYGAIGLLAGVVLNRFGGVYTLFILPMLDLFVIQRPMQTVTQPAGATLLPGHAVMRLAISTGFHGSVVLTDIGTALAYLTALAAAATAALYTTIT